MGTGYHKGVLVKEAVGLLVHKKDGLYVDATLGGGDHTEALLNTSKKLRVLGIDRDMDSINEVTKRFSRFSRLTIVHGAFADIKRLVRENSYEEVSGILFDLGLSSHQIDISERGFSFDNDGPLDMRANRRDDEKTAYTVLNHYSPEDLMRIFWEYGDFKKSRRLTELIINSRPLNTTGELRDLVSEIVDSQKVQHGLSQVFQAVRIEVNDEVGQLKKGLEDSLDILPKGGRIAVISYHSLEDRIVKMFFNMESKVCICPPEMPICRCGHEKSIEILTKKPIKPSVEEIKMNCRARSAILRVIRKI